MREETSKDLIADAARRHMEWEEVSKKDRLAIYVRLTREDKEPWESLFSKDENHDFQAMELMVDIAEFDRLEDWVRLRESLFINLEEYYYWWCQERVNESREEGRR